MAPGNSKSNERRSTRRSDPSLQHAKEAAEGVDVYEDPYADEALRMEREEAQGTEVFRNPDEVLPLSALKEGSPSHETLASEQAGIEPDGDEEDRDRSPDEGMPEV